MAKNVERQRSLDRKKWKQSENEKCDLSGSMDYCDHCEYLATNIHTGVRCCIANQELRERDSLCAKAYNRMVYRNNKKIK